MSTHILVIVICLAFSAYFSATETAFSSFNKTKMKTMAENGDGAASLVCKLSERYDKLLSTILVGNNVVNILLATMSTLLFVDVIKAPNGATISTAVSTVIVLIFGEITPKSIAKDSAEKIAKLSAPLLKILIVLLTPINFLFSMWKKLLTKIFRLKADTKMSQEELLMLVEEVQENGSIDAKEGDLLRNAIEFTDREAEDILTHRMDLEAVPITATKEEIAKVFEESKFSRILVYEDSIDNIVGQIHQKDFYTGSGITSKPISEIMTDVVFVPKNEKISALLQELQKEKTHIAVVVDEHGGTYGIVTIEDILEELVGEIWDEHEEKSEEITQTAPDTFLVDGSMAMSDFCDHFDIKTDSEMVLLSGWVMEQLGEVPDSGAAFTYENLEITVTKVENCRILQIQVHRLPAPVEEADEEAES